MDEQHQELFNGVIALVLIIDTIAIFSLALGMPLQSSSQNQVNSQEGIASNPSVMQTIISASAPVRTTPPLIKTPVPTPTLNPVRKGYVTIFYMDDYNIETSLPPIFFNLVNPPLIITYSVKPQNSTDLKLIEYKTLSKYHEDIVNITRPYEEAYFKIMATGGDVALEEGYGKEFGLISPNTMVVRSRGNFKIGMEGKNVNVTLSIEVPKEGNFP